MRKVLSFVLVLTLILGSFSFSFASTTAVKTASDVVGTEYEDAVKVLMNLGVVTGYPDGTYKPDGAVTRAEIAALIVRALGIASTDTAVAKSNFSDMKGNWADNYVALLADRNIIKGYSDGTFKPNAKVSFPETITMIVRALGYTDGCTSLSGTWPTNYMTLASNLNITNTVKVLASSPADRGSVAIMLNNALIVPNVTVDKSTLNASKVIINGSGDTAKYLTLLSNLTAANDGTAISPPAVTTSTSAIEGSGYGVFAINSVSETKNASEDNVYELNGFINGTRADMLTDNMTITYTPASIYFVRYDDQTIKNSKSFSFYSLNAGNIESKVGKGCSIINNEIVTKTGSSDYFKTASGVLTLDSNPIIYIAVYIDGSIDSYKVGKISDIRKDDHVSYILNKDGDVALVVVTTQDDVANAENI